MLAHTREAVDRGKALHAEWNEGFEAWADANPERKALLDRVLAGDLPEDAFADVPVFPAGKAVSTRVASGKVINGIAKHVPEFWGGSADLAESNNTTIEGVGSFLPPERATAMWKANPYGRVLHFGIREHAMGNILNGIVLHGNTRVFGATFLIFSDYMRPAGPARRADEGADDLRLDPRLGRPRRRRTDPPAGRDPLGAPPDPGARHHPPGRRERDRRGVEADHVPPHGSGRARAQPPEPARLRARRRRGVRRRLRVGGRRREGRLRLRRGEERHARRDPDRDRAPSCRSPSRRA